MNSGCMGEDDIASMTVSKLKELLKEKGLPVSGNKAELVARLEENAVLAKPKSVLLSADKTANSTKKSVEGELPFLLAIKEGGLGDVEIDKWKAASYGMVVFMFIMMIIGLNSMSWYSMGLERIDGKESLNFEIGLSEYESVEEEGDGDVEIRVEDLDSCRMLYYYGAIIMDDEKAARSNCDTLSSGGGIIQFFIWFSMIGVILLLAFSMAVGFGVFYSGPIADNLELIEKILWGISVFPLLLGVVIYGFFVGLFVDLELGGDSDWEVDLFSHLGWMWWLMMLSSIAYTWIVYNERIKKFISSIKNRN